MLMQWVKKHIASVSPWPPASRRDLICQQPQFGGDPDHVVIHGASAGAGSVAMHLVAHGGRDDNLFVGAMAESVFFPAQPFVPELEYQFDRFAHHTGCDNTSRSDQMACLRSQPIAVLQDANTAQPFPGQYESTYPLFYWTPCIDGDFLQDLPYALINQGKIIDVPVLFGTDTDGTSPHPHPPQHAASSLTSPNRRLSLHPSHHLPLLLPLLPHLQLPPPHHKPHHRHPRPLLPAPPAHPRPRPLVPHRLPRLRGSHLHLPHVLPPLGGPPPAPLRLPLQRARRRRRGRRPGGPAPVRGGGRVWAGQHWRARGGELQDVQPGDCGCGAGVLD